MSRYIGTGQVYAGEIFLGDVRYELSTGPGGVVSHPTGMLYAQNSLEFIFGGPLPELIMRMRKEELQFRFDAVRTEFELPVFVYDIVFRSPLERYTRRADG